MTLGVCMYGFGVCMCAFDVCMRILVSNLDFHIVTVPPFLSSPHGQTGLTGVFAKNYV